MQGVPMNTNIYFLGLEAHLPQETFFYLSVIPWTLRYPCNRYLRKTLSKKIVFRIFQFSTLASVRFSIILSRCFLSSCIYLFCTHFFSVLERFELVNWFTECY